MVSVTNASPNGLQTTHVYSDLDTKKTRFVKKKSAGQGINA